ncbi:MAG: amidohydrolase family protein [Betaproteobacteria bacterium]
MTPIIDSHHHIWRQTDLPWLRGPMLPRIFGPYEPLRRDYPIEEFLADIAASGVVGSVYVQANWAKEQAVEEVAWVQSVADTHGWPQAIVGYVDLLGDDARNVLKRQAAFPLMRGARMQIHWHENPLYRFASAPDLTAHPRLRENIRALAEHGFTFDLQVFTAQMAGAAQLAAANRDITFVLQHAGMLEDLSAAGIAAWREGMRRLAGEPNIVAKLSAFGTFIHRNDPAHIAFMVAETIALFGPQRCMFGSNFPIEKLWTSYDDLVAAYRNAVAGLPEEVQHMVLNANAARIYGLDKRK